MDAVTNQSRNEHTAAIPLKFDPYTPRWADFNGDDGRHCLLGISAKDRGAHTKLGFILLRRPQAMTPALAFVKKHRDASSKFLDASTPLITGSHFLAQNGRPSAYGFYQKTVGK